MKTCRKCKKTEVEVIFERIRRVCVICTNKRHAKYYQKNKLSFKNYYLKNKELIAQQNLIPERRAKRLLQHSKWQKLNRENCSARSMKRHAAKLKRIPQWLISSDYIEINWAYTLARQMTKETGIKHVVDHIIPLQGKNISGLHCPQNLQVITSSENVRKHNKFPYYKDSI